MNSLTAQIPNKSLCEEVSEHDIRHQQIIKDVTDRVNHIISSYLSFINTSGSARNEDYTYPLVEGHIIHKGVLSFVKSIFTAPLIYLEIPTYSTGPSDARGGGHAYITVCEDDCLELAEQLKEGLKPYVGNAEITIRHGDSPYFL